MSVRYAIIIPACNESSCIEATLCDLGAQQIPGCGIVVGVNGSDDGTAELARKLGANVAETTARGYGYGCSVAIEHALSLWPAIDSFIFFSADGSNTASDVRLLIEARERGADMVLGCRTLLPENRKVMGVTHTLANRLLGATCGLLTGRYFFDLGPLRLITSQLMEEIDPIEMTFGWTIEAQVRAGCIGANIVEINVREFPRRAGVQKVSRVSLARTIRIGCEIFYAGFRSRFRPIRTVPSQAATFTKATEPVRGS